MERRTDIGDRLRVVADGRIVAGRVTALVPGYGVDIINSRGQHFRIPRREPQRR